MTRNPALAARDVAFLGHHVRCLKITRRRPIDAHRRPTNSTTRTTTAIMDPNAFPSPPGTAERQQPATNTGPQKRVRDSLGVAGNNDRTWQDRLGGLREARRGGRGDRGHPSTPESE